MPAEDDDPLAGLARDPGFAEAGTLFRAERRAEAAEYEELAARDALRERSLGAVARDLLARGDLVAVSVQGRTFTGTLTHAATDLVCLRTPAGEDIDVRLGDQVALRVVESVRAGGSSPAADPASFAARLAEHEAAGTVLEFGTRAPDGGLVGRVVAVATDHVVVAALPSADRWFVARTALDYVLPRRM